MVIWHQVNQSCLPIFNLNLNELSKHFKWMSLRGKDLPQLTSFPLLSWENLVVESKSIKEDKKVG